MPPTFEYSLPLHFDTVAPDPAPTRPNCIVEDATTAAAAGDNDDQPDSDLPSDRSSSRDTPLRTSEDERFREIVLAWCLPGISTVAQQAYMYYNFTLQTPVVVRSGEVVEVHWCVCRDAGIVDLQITQDEVRERDVAMRSSQQGFFIL